MQAVFEFIKDIFSFEDPFKSITALLGCLALLSLVFIDRKKHSQFFMALVGTIVVSFICFAIIMLQKGPVVTTIKMDKLTLILHESANHANRYIVNRGKVVLYSNDANKKAAYDIGKSGIVTIDNMLDWMHNDSTGIQVSLSGLDTLKENATVIGNPYLMRSNDTIRIGYAHFTINAGDKVAANTPKPPEAREIVVFFNKKDERNRCTIKQSTSVSTLKTYLLQTFYSDQELSKYESTSLAINQGNTTLIDESKLIADAGIQNGEDLWLIGRPKPVVMYKSVEAPSTGQAVQSKLVFTGQTFKKPVLKIDNQATLLKKVGIDTYEALYFPTSKPKTVSITDGTQTYSRHNVKLSSVGVKMDVASMKRSVMQDKKYIDRLKYENVIMNKLQSIR